MRAAAVHRAHHIQIGGELRQRIADDLEDAGAILAGALRRWATGIYVVWDPLKHRGPVKAFHAALVSGGIRRVLAAELLLRPDTDPDQLNGSGLIVVNPPWRLAEALASLLAALLADFGASAHGRVRVETLVPE